MPDCTVVCRYAYLPSLQLRIVQNLLGLEFNEAVYVPNVVITSMYPGGTYATQPMLRGKGYGILRGK